jgi:hypothetical protein
MTYQRGNAQSPWALSYTFTSVSHDEPGLFIVKSNVLVSASKNANGNSVCRPMGGTEGRRLTIT